MDIFILVASHLRCIEKLVQDVSLISQSYIRGIFSRKLYINRSRFESSGVLYIHVCPTVRTVVKNEQERLKELVIYYCYYNYYHYVVSIYKRECVNK